MTRTGKSPRLSQHIAEPFLDINPSDAAEHGLIDGAWAELSTAYGRAVLRVSVNDQQQQGSVFAPIHWSNNNSAAARIGALAQPITDPISGQPEVKATPTRIRAYKASFDISLFSRRKPGLSGVLAGSVSRFEHGFATRLACEAPSEDWALWAKKWLGPGDYTSFEDAGSDTRRYAVFGNNRLEAVLTISKTDTAFQMPIWLKHAFGKAGFTANERRAILAGRSFRARETEIGSVICVCFQVCSVRIAKAVKNGAITVEAVGAALQAGTNCGSCVPEIKRLIQSGVQAIKTTADCAAS